MYTYTRPERIIPLRTRIVFLEHSRERIVEIVINYEAIVVRS